MITPDYTERVRFDHACPRCGSLAGSRDTRTDRLFCSMCGKSIATSGALSGASGPSERSLRTHQAARDLVARAWEVPVIMLSPHLPTPGRDHVPAIATPRLAHDHAEPEPVLDHAPDLRNVIEHCWRCGSPATTLDASLEHVCTTCAAADRPPELSASPAPARRAAKVGRKSGRTRPKAPARDVTDEDLVRYSTRVEPDEYCTCPDYGWRRVGRGQVCKHIQAMIDRARLRIAEAVE